jgi:tetratricopeptide (TPR) repeat protein
MSRTNLIASTTITIIFIALSTFYYFDKNNKYTEDAFVHKASHYFKNENYFQAIRYYKKLILMGNCDEKNYINIATSLIKTGNYNNAINYLLNMEKNNMISCDMYYLLAYSYYLKTKNIDKRNDFKTSIKYLEKSLKLDSANKNVYKLLGIIYENSNDFEEARKYYKKALFEDIDNTYEFYGLIANSYFKENEYDDAIKYYKKAIEINKNYISSYCNIAKIYSLKNNFAKAEEYYKKAIELSPEYIFPYYKIGSLYFIKQEYESAIQWYKKALEIEPNEAIVNYYIGITYKKLNMQKEAVDHLKLAAYCGNDNAVKELRTLLKNF